jgi:hypothetical protein
VNGGGEPSGLSVSFVALFLGAVAMANPGIRRDFDLSSPTQSGVKGLRDGPKVLLCRSAMRHETFEIESS